MERWSAVDDHFEALLVPDDPGDRG